MTLSREATIRLEFAVTILLDGLVILTALVVRTALLWALAKAAPTDSHNWAIHALEFISDIGMVVAAAAFTVFDLTKRAVTAWKALRAEISTPGVGT